VSAPLLGLEQEDALNIYKHICTIGVLLAGSLLAVPAHATPVFFSNGNVDGRMAAA
jgi:hypothetical protein